MIDVERFKIRKHDLKAIVQALNPESYAKELKTYDFMVNVCEKNNHKVMSELEEIFSELKSAQDFSQIPELLEDAKTELVYWKTKHKHDPAFIFVHNFGMDKSYDYSRHLSRFVAQEGIAGKYFLDSSILKHMEHIAYEDGAILIDEKQNIVATHAHIINLNPPGLIAKHYAESVRKNYTSNNPRYFGFRQDLNTRHLSALYSSFHFPSSIIYTLGERLEVRDDEGKLVRIEDGHIRRYQDGLITFSTFDKESDTVKRSLEILKKS